jgi:hypothetical protein
VSSKVSREIQCLTRLQELTGQLEDVISFLKLEGLIDDNQIKTIKLSPDHPKMVREMLQDLKIRQKIQLLQYEWNVLPVENIALTIITDRNHRDFIYNGG